MSKDVEYELNQKVRDALVLILEHNIKYGVSEEFPDLDELEDKAWQAVHALDNYYNETL